MMADGSSERGLSEVIIAQIAEPAGHFTHHRAFPLVPVAAAAENGYDPPCGKLGQGSQHIFQRVPGMGVIYKQPDTPVVFHPLQPAGDLFVSFYAADNGGERQVQGYAGGGGRKDIVEVETPRHA